MSDLSTLLASIGETCPHRPATLFMTEALRPGELTARDQYALALEQTLARVAGRLAEREKNAADEPKVVGEEACETCEGWGSYFVYDTAGHDVNEDGSVLCKPCSGTGRTGAQP